MSKSPVKDFSRLLGNSRTLKKQSQPSHYYRGIDGTALYAHNSYVGSGGVAAEVRKRLEDYDVYAAPRYQPERKYEQMDSEAISNELKNKLELSLRHNTRLLDENATLSEMTTGIRTELKLANERVSNAIREQQEILRKTASERENLLVEVAAKQASQEVQVKQLLEEISRLHSERNEFEIAKGKQIESVRSEYERALFQSIRNLKNCQASSKDLYETQIQSLRDALASLQNDLEASKSAAAAQKLRLNESIRGLQGELKHLRQMSSMELSSMKAGFQSDLKAEKRRVEKDKQLEVGEFTVKLRRLKKDLLEKNKQLEVAQAKMLQTEELVRLEAAQLKQEKECILSEMTSNELKLKQCISEQKQRQQALAAFEVANIQQLHETEVAELQSEVEGLRLLLEAKTEQIRRLYEQSNVQRSTSNSQISQLSSENSALREKIQQLELDRKEDMEAIKIKMSTLFESNIKSLTDYYDRELTGLSQANNDLSRQIRDAREKLFGCLQENDDLRKRLQLELSKAKARIQDLKIKLAATSMEHKEQVASLGSKVEMTSQSLIREADSQGKQKGFSEEERKKVYMLLSTKDKENADLLGTIQSMKKGQQADSKNHSESVAKLQNEIDELLNEKNKLKNKFEEDIRARDAKINAFKNENSKELEEIKLLQDRVAEAQKQLLHWKKQADHMTMLNNAITAQLGLSKGFIENLQMESSAAIEQEKRKLKVTMGAHEVSLKDYFEQKVTSKDAQIEGLKKQLGHREQDLRQIVVKYNALEKRLNMVLQAQDKLTDLEEKIKSLGLDQNLVKNMSQLFARRGDHKSSAK